MMKNEPWPHFAWPSFLCHLSRELYLFLSPLIIFFILSLIPSGQASPSLSQEHILIVANEQLLRRSNGGSCLASLEHLLMLSLKSLLPLAPMASPLSAFPTIPLVAACKIPFLVLVYHPSLRHWGHAELSTLTSAVLPFILTLLVASSGLKIVSCMWCALIIPSVQNAWSSSTSFDLTEPAAKASARSVGLHSRMLPGSSLPVNSLLASCQVTDNYWLDYCGSFLDGPATVLASLESPAKWTARHLSQNMCSPSSKACQHFSVWCGIKVKVHPLLAKQTPSVLSALSRPSFLAPLGPLLGSLVIPSQGTFLPRAFEVSFVCLKSPTPTWVSVWLLWLISLLKVFTECPSFYFFLSRLSKITPRALCTRFPISCFLTRQFTFTKSFHRIHFMYSSHYSSLLPKVTFHQGVGVDFIFSFSTTTKAFGVYNHTCYLISICWKSGI